MNANDYGQLTFLDDQGHLAPELEQVGHTIPARHTDPPTSHQATEEIRVKAGSQRAKLLAVYADYPMRGLTDDEAQQFAVGVSERSCYWKRCSELRDGGYITDTGETRAGVAGPQRMVCRITEKGMAWLAVNAS